MLVSYKGEPDYFGLVFGHMKGLLVSLQICTVVGYMVKSSEVYLGWFFSRLSVRGC